ncbi:MAG: hypothetical protein ABH891_00295 [Candidatus Omnitrophota bacterium]
MKKMVIVMLVLMLLNLCVPGAQAEISQDLDPMVPVDSQATVTEETSVSNATTGQANDGVNVTGAKASEIKTEKPKKEKTKKNSTEKFSSKKSGKSSSKNCKANKGSSR